MPPDRTAASFAISALALDDMPSVKAIERAGQAFPWSDSMIAEELSCDHAYHFGARIDRNAPFSAFILCRMFCSELAIHNLCTDPEKRRRGLATALIRHVIAHARDRGARAAFLEVRPSNDAAVALYSREGFSALNLRKKYYANGDDALTLTLSLI